MLHRKGKVSDCVGSTENLKDLKMQRTPAPRIRVQTPVIPRPCLTPLPLHIPISLPDLSLPPPPLPLLPAPLTREAALHLTRGQRTGTKRGGRDQRESSLLTTYWSESTQSSR